jgi:hypothetical protein
MAFSPLKTGYLGFLFWVSPTTAALRQQQPVVSSVLEQSTAGLYKSLLHVNHPFSIFFGSTNRRHSFARLYASTLGHSRTSFARNRWQLSRVKAHAFRGAVIHHHEYGDFTFLARDPQGVVAGPLH